MKFIKPQLAKNLGSLASKLDFKNKKYVAERKMDGHRCLLSRDHAWSRSGRELNLPHLQKEIPEGCLLDGELIVDTGNCTDSDVTSALAQRPESIEVIVFDILYYDGKSVMGDSWDDRSELLGHVFDSTEIDSDQIYNSEPDVFSSLKDLSKAAFFAKKQGWEGIVIKDAGAKYVPGARSNWYKYKFTQDVDVVIVDALAAVDRWRVKPGCVGKDGHYYARGLLTDSYRAGFIGLRYGYYDTETAELRIVGSLGVTGPSIDMERLIGRVAKVTVSGVFKSGALKHIGKVTFRDDKPAAECVFDFEK